jgi:hypothetical protein
MMPLTTMMMSRIPTTTAMGMTIALWSSIQSLISRDVEVPSHDPFEQCPPAPQGVPSIKFWPNKRH